MRPFRSVHIGLVAGLAAASVTVFGLSGHLNAAPGDASSVVPTVPCRLLDTRATSTVGPRSTPIGPAEEVIVAVWGTNGNCTVPDTATGIVANVTTINGTADSFLAVFPADATRPLTSNQNWLAENPREPHPNQVTVALSATGAIKLFNGYGTVDVIVDIMSYLTPESGGAPTPGTIGPVLLIDQPDRGCAEGGTQEVWALTDSERHFVIEPAQDGTGYIVTRYDTNGTFESVEGASFPDCDLPGTFTSEGSTGTWSGVWTRKVVMTADLDYNPDAVLPPTATWDDLFLAYFGLDGTAVDVPTLSYEFDYYNACDDHWRDAFYAGTRETSGTIDNCPAP